MHNNAQVHTYVRMHRCTQVCTSVHAQVCTSVHRCAQVCTGVHAQVYTSVHAEVCTSVHRYVFIGVHKCACTSLHNCRQVHMCAQVSTSMPKCAQLYTSVYKCDELLGLTNRSRMPYTLERGEGAVLPIYFSCLQPCICSSAFPCSFGVPAAWL